METPSSLEREYWKEGYAVLRGLFDREALARFEERFVEIASGRFPAPQGAIVMRDVMFAKGAIQAARPIDAVNKLLSFEHDETLFSYATDPKLLAAVRTLVGEEVMTISTNVFNKPPGLDGRHPLHQDLRYFALRPEDAIVAAWTAISPMSRENGCLAVIPGSHRRGLLPHGSPDWEFVNRGFFAAEGIDLSERVHVAMQPGDTLLFHPLLIHGSGRNRSRDFRRAISSHYASTRCERPAGQPRSAPVIRVIGAAATD